LPLLTAPISTLFPYTTLFRSTNFNTLNLPSQYGCENIRIPTYVAADGSSCGATVNYDIYRWLDIDLPHDGITIPIPVKFVKNCRSEEHTSELQSRFDLVCRLL